MARTDSSTVRSRSAVGLRLLAKDGGRDTDHVMVSAAHGADASALIPLFAEWGHDGRRWPTRHELRLAIITWIETTYHRRRRQHALGRLTPIEFEILQQAATAA